MRFELDNDLLFICSGAFFLTFWFVTSYCHSKRVALIAKSFTGALVMPAFAPGHGEFVMLLPNAGLFTVSSPFAWGLGVFFLILNFFILLALFSWISRKI